MEASTEDQLDRAMEQPDVVGIIVADHHGLCVGYRGEAHPNRAGQVASLCHEANKLINNPKDVPTIVLESNEGKARTMMLRQSNDIYTGVILKSSATNS